MTKEGYTHIIVPKDLHAILKQEAEARNMSIASYIAELMSAIQHIQSIGELVNRDITTVTGINTTIKPDKPSESSKSEKKNGNGVISS